MYTSDIFFNPDISLDIKQAVLELLDSERISFDASVLKRTATNNDVDGSQHDGEIDFTYEDADENDVRETTSLGYYEYFSQYGFGTYTGHYYNGSDQKFAAIVINPPAYAATVYV